MTATPERIKDVNERYHDVAAETYDSKWGIDYGKIGQEQVLAKMRKALGTKDVGPFGDSLEIGAGTGYFTLNLLRAGAIDSATATDISPGMLKALKDNAKNLGLKVATKATEAESLPFDDESFDVVFGHAVLHHIPDLGKAFHEFDRVLRPGGYVAFCGEPSRYGDMIAAGPKRAALLTAPLWRRAIGASERDYSEDHADTNGHALETEVDVHAFSPGDLRDFVEDAGFDSFVSRARSSSPTCTAGRCAPSRRPPSPRTCRGAGASSPSAATSPSRRSTTRCSSPTCRPRSSTTWC